MICGVGGWKELAASEPRVTGVIERVTGPAGFIRASGGESLYFNAREIRNATAGIEVDFWIRESWDHKKARASRCAIRIRELNTSRSRRPR